MGPLSSYRKTPSHGRRVAKRVAVAVAAAGVAAVVAAVAAEGRAGPGQVARAQPPLVVADWPIGSVSWRSTFTIRTRLLASGFIINNNPHLSRPTRGTTAFPAT
jgi:hypothetical protein